MKTDVNGNWLCNAHGGDCDTHGILQAAICCSAQCFCLYADGYKNYHMIYHMDE